MKRIIDRFEAISNVKVRQIEVDKGGEFMGQTSRMFRSATAAEKKKGGKGRTLCERANNSKNTERYGRTDECNNAANFLELG